MHSSEKEGKGFAIMSKKTGKPKGQALELPRNIQQMGQTDGGIKVYLEDYSGTWLRRILSEESLCHGILLGKKQVSGNRNYFFIQAVLSVKPTETETYWKYDWNEIYRMMQQYFVEEGKEPLAILGWAMPVEDYAGLDIKELESMHKANFQDNMTLVCTIDRQEGREQFYISENNKFHSLGGYYIYYEKNKAMQNYVLENQSGPCVETEEIVKGSGESYRTMLLKRKEMLQKRYTVSILYAASTFLVMLVIVLGISMMNSYEKMKTMETALNDLSKSVINGEVSAQSAVSSQAAEQLCQRRADVSKESVTVMSAVVTGPVVTTEPPETTQDAGLSRKRYEIQPGDTLLAISMKVYNTDQMVEKICEYNEIENGDQIVAGDVLILP